MANPQKFSTVGWKGVDTTFAAHVQSPPGTDIIQSVISGITYTVTEMRGPQQNVVTGSGTLVVANTVFNTLQTPITNPSWTQDNNGYNFLGAIPGAQIPDAGDYVVLFLFALTAGGTPVPLEFYHHANSLS